MSAYIVSKKHIDVLVGARKGRDGYVPSAHLSDDALGRQLWAENRKSVNVRYGTARAILKSDDKADLAAYRYEQPETLQVVALLKAINSYEYQACEHKAWERSAAKRYCGELREMLVKQLPGYDAAPWSI